MRTTLSHLWEKVQIFLRFSLAHVIPIKSSYAVMFLLVNFSLHDCLKVVNFCQIWPGNSGFKSIEFLQVLCRRATELQHIGPSHWGRSSSLSSLVGCPCTERGYQRPCCAKSRKGACSSWGKASCQHWAFTLKLIHKKCSGPRAGISRWSQGAASRQSKALQSQRRERFDTILLRNSVLLSLL